MNNEFALLNLNKNLLKPGIEHKASTTGFSMVTAYYMNEILDMINDDIKDFFEKTKIEPSKMLVFYQLPGYTNQTIHVDGTDKVFSFSVNWIYSTEKTLYKFYKPLIQKEDTSFYDKANIKYITYQEHEVELINSIDDNGPLVINTQIPHKGENLDQIHPRWSYCIRTRTRFNSMPELLEHIKDYIRK